MKHSHHNNASEHCDSNIHDHDTSICFHDATAMKECFSRINIVSTYSDIKQIPDTTNNRTAIVKSTVQTDTGRFEGIGCASSEHLNGSLNMQSIIDAACIASLNRATALALYATGNVHTVTVSGTSVQSGGSVQNSHLVRSSNTAQRQHKTAIGSISERQMALISKIASERSTTVEQLARDICQCDPQSLSSSDAHKIIQYIRDNKRYR